MIDAERAGIEHLKERVQNDDVLRKEAHTLLALLLSGAGAALYFAASHAALSGSALAVSLWLFAVALVLTARCLMFGDYPAVWNEPKNLYQPDFSLMAVREVELKNLQQRIEQATELNATRSRWLNYCIIASCLTPGVGFIAGLVLVRDFCA
jgi:hypothetical protein